MIIDPVFSVVSSVSIITSRGILIEADAAAMKIEPTIIPVAHRVIKVSFIIT